MNDARKDRPPPVWQTAKDKVRESGDGTVPLARALSTLGVASRTQTQTQEWIEAGRLSVNDRIVKDLKFAVVPESDRFAFDGNTLQQQERSCIALHKPRGYVATRSDEKKRKTIYTICCRPSCTSCRPWVALTCKPVAFCCSPTTPGSPAFLLNPPMPYRANTLSVLMAE